MNRREFLRYSLYTTAMIGATAHLSHRYAHAFAVNGAGLTAPGRTLINTMLLGGADLRYLLVPAPGTPYAERFWEARQSLYRDNAQNQQQYAAYPDVWEDLYLPTTRDGLTFGIHKEAAWLKTQFDAGNVAIVANVLGSENRRHDHSQLIINTGDPEASQYIYDRDGWGGRLAYAIGEAKTIATTNDISVFCNGTEADNRTARVIHAKDTRNFGLSSGNGNPRSAPSALARALKGYYAEKRKVADSKPQNWPYRRFFQHEQALRQFGDALKARLDEVAPEQPESLQSLYNGQAGTRLNSPYFGQQCASIFDSYLAADLFKLRIASLEYGGWDTHRQLKNSFESRISDIFGSSKGLDTLTQELETVSEANENTVYVFTTDFGRQLRANGDFGTDHGRGNYMILIGPGVQGGTYGEMFPVSEIQGSPGETRFDQQGADIEGRTSFELILAAVCDWIKPGTGPIVFPNVATGDLPIEPGVDLTQLFV